MATGLRVNPLSQEQKQLATRQQADPRSRVWKREEMEDDDSWEVRAFAEDTSLLGMTWPPRSYTCSFCRREFRSAQALGGHMNVHRRDRARLRQSPSGFLDPSPSSALPVLPVFSLPEFVAGGGICFFYQVPVAGAVCPPTGASPTPLSILPRPCNGLVSSCSTVTQSSQVETPGRNNKEDNSKADGTEGAVEELDLELRLGW